MDFRVPEIGIQTAQNHTNFSVKLISRKNIPEFRVIHTRMHHLKTVYSMFALQVVTQTSYLLGEHTGSRGK